MNSTVPLLPLDLVSKLVQQLEKSPSKSQDPDSDRDKEKSMIHIHKVQMDPMEQGVMSRVYRVTTEWTTHDNNNNNMTKKKKKNNNNWEEKEQPSTAASTTLLSSSSSSSSFWVAKFLRNGLGLDWMFQCETTFYKHFATSFGIDDNNEDNHLPTQTARNDDNHDKTIHISYSNRNTINSNPLKQQQQQQQQQELPFRVPKALYCSNQCIILQGIQNVTCHELSKGCPTIETMEFCIDALAILHGHFWNSSVAVSPSLLSSLCTPPGMGQRLHPLQKESLFQSQWMEFLQTTFGTTKTNNNNSKNYCCLDKHYNPMESSGTSKTLEEPNLIYEECLQLLQTLSNYRLRDVHTNVHEPNKQKTLVHGDYHISNWLFPSTSTTSNTKSKPILIDWATCGYGNPMIDVAFFFIVSTNDAVVSNHMEVWLQRYYTKLMEQIQSNNNNNNNNDTTDNQEEFSYETCLEWYQWAVLNQLLILIAYDPMVRKMFQQEPDCDKRTKEFQHLDNVNRRALLAVLQCTITATFDKKKSHRDNHEMMTNDCDHQNNGEGITSRQNQGTCWNLEPITKEERMEASLYVQNTPLAI